jgi:hypothetical protein
MILVLVVHPRVMIKNAQGSSQGRTEPVRKRDRAGQESARPESGIGVLALVTKHVIRAGFTVDGKTDLS